MNKDNISQAQFLAKEALTDLLKIKQTSPEKSLNYIIAAAKKLDIAAAYTKQEKIMFS